MSRLGVVFGSYAPMHQGHLETVIVAKKHCDKVLVLVCGRDGDKGCPILPVATRFQMVRKFFSDDSFVDVRLIDENALVIPQYPNGWNKWIESFERIRGSSYCDYDVHFYVGDEEYYSGLLDRNYSVTLIDRHNNPISASLIRANPLRYWDKIVPTFRPAFSHNILITGTASEGKTTLVGDLGRYFNAPVSYEYAREYMDDRNLREEELTVEDYLAFLQGQYGLNREMIESKANRGIFFADTDAITTKMYASYYLDDADLSIGLDQYNAIDKAADYFATAIKWDKIFVLAPTLGFEDDGVRYMKHGSLEIRMKMHQKLIEFYRNVGLDSKIEVLGTIGENRDYISDFERIKKYVEGIVNS